jgi:two-component system sensor histidine kinase UhpB
LRGSPDEVRLELRDDGRGLPAAGPPRDGHYGLRWLRERVEALHGSVALDNVPPRGARLAVRLPLIPETA